MEEGVQVWLKQGTFTRSSHWSRSLHKFGDWVVEGLHVFSLHSDHRKLIVYHYFIVNSY